MCIWYWLFNIYQNSITYNYLSVRNVLWKPYPTPLDASQTFKFLVLIVLPRKIFDHNDKMFYLHFRRTTSVWHSPEHLRFVFRNANIKPGLIKNKYVYPIHIYAIAIIRPRRPGKRLQKEKAECLETLFNTLGFPLGASILYSFSTNFVLGYIHFPTRRVHTVKCFYDNEYVSCKLFLIAVNRCMCNEHIFGHHIYATRLFIQVLTRQ